MRAPATRPPGPVSRQNSKESMMSTSIYSSPSPQCRDGIATAAATVPRTMWSTSAGDQLDRRGVHRREPRTAPVAGDSHSDIEVCLGVVEEVAREYGQPQVRERLGQLLVGPAGLLGGRPRGVGDVSGIGGRFPDQAGQRVD